MKVKATTLGEICRSGGGGIQTGPFGSQLHASDYVIDGTPSVMPQNIGENRILTDGIARVSKIDVQRLSKYLLREGDIVYSRRGDVERRALVRSENDGWLCGTGCLRVRLGDSNSSDPRFMSYILGTEEARSWIVRHAVGATMLNLNTSILSALPLNIPSYAEQLAIAEVLGALDDKIAANRIAFTLIDELLASLLDHLLESDDPTLVTLSEIADINSRKVKPANGETLRYLDITSLRVGTFEYPELTSWESAPSRARRKIERGDTVWSTVRPNRRAHALILLNDSKLVGSTGLAVISPRATGFAYLYELTKRPEFSSYLETVAEGSAYPAVRGELFAQIPVSLMSDDVRRGFEDLAAPLREWASTLSTENRTLATMRDTLLPHLMSGRLRVKDAEKMVSDEA